MSTTNNTQAQARQTADQAQAKARNAANQIASHPLVQQGSQAVNQQLNALDKELSKYGFLNDIEARTRVPKTYGFLGLSITFVLIILLNFLGLASPVSNALGFLIPAYLSISALESPGTNDDKQWLTYWIIFGLLNFIESSMLRLVLYYFPMYFTFKTAAIVWLMLPQTRGAELVYNSALRPLFLSGRSKVREVQQEAKSAAPNTNRATHSSTSSFSASTTNPSTGFSSAGTTAPAAGLTTGSSSVSGTGYTSSAEPFVGNSAEGLGQRNVGGIPIPQAAGHPLPDTL